MTIYPTLADRPTEEALNKIGGGGGDSGSGDQTNGNVATALARLGVSLAPLTPELARAANLPATVRGVIITKVDPNGGAADQGLQRGDLIMSVNNQPVTTPAQVTAMVETARRAGRSSVLLLVKRATAPEAFVAVNITGQ
jgi:serine protease Do